jgi:hypothetical protein
MGSESAVLGFEYRIRKSGDVEILRFGRHATNLRGMEAREFLAETTELHDVEIQQERAQLAGNHKRGNERMAANHPRSRSLKEWTTARYAARYQGTQHPRTTLPAVVYSSSCDSGIKLQPGLWFQRIVTKLPAAPRIARSGPSLRIHPCSKNKTEPGSARVGFDL